MSESIILRTATHADAAAVTNIYLTSRKELLAFAPLAHSDANVYKWIHDLLIPTNLVFVAEKNGAIIGMMALFKDQNIGWIEQLYLLPSTVGQGVGKLLVNKAKTTLGSPIRLHTFQENIHAKRFYEQNGFQLLSLSDGSTNEEKCPDALYEWRND